MSLDHEHHNIPSAEWNIIKNKRFTQLIYLSIKNIGLKIKKTVLLKEHNTKIYILWINSNTYQYPTKEQRSSKVNRT